MDDDELSWVYFSVGDDSSVDPTEVLLVDTSTAGKFRDETVPKSAAEAMACVACAVQKISL